MRFEFVSLRRRSRGAVSDEGDELCRAEVKRELGSEKERVGGGEYEMKRRDKGSFVVLYGDKMRWSVCPRVFANQNSRARRRCRLTVGMYEHFTILSENNPKMQGTGHWSIKATSTSL